MSRLLVNPGTPQAWEIMLKHGATRLGRGEQNDFQINHPTVSTSHAEVVLSSAGVVLKDLGSTNGTFVNRAPVHEALLQSGQHVQLGAIDMLFETDAGLPPVSLPAELPPLPPVVRPTAVHATPGAGEATFCKFHPKTPARFLCPKCHQSFCDLCVATRAEKKFCRACGSECTPVQVRLAQRAAPKSFFARLPGSFVYPFRGSGLLVLLAATFIFSLLGAVSGGISIFATMIALGYLFSYMQNIIHCTAAEDDEMPTLPGFDGIFSAFFTLVGVVLFCFGLPIGLTAAKFFFDIEIPAGVLLSTMFVCCLYFPMAFLAVAMKDSVMSANPLVVVPAILKVPVEYLVTTVLLTAVFGIRVLGNATAFAAKTEGYMTRDMSVLFITFGIRALWSFLSVYLLTVGMRILGLLYLTRKDKLGWFSH